MRKSAFLRSSASNRRSRMSRRIFVNRSAAALRRGSDQGAVARRSADSGLDAVQARRRTAGCAQSQAQTTDGSLALSRMRFERYDTGDFFDEMFDPNGRPQYPVEEGTQPIRELV